MKLYQFNDWYQQAVDYWSDPNHIDCPDKCVEKLKQLKSEVESYFSNTGESYVWFKRIVSTMLSLRLTKFHMEVYKIVGEDENGQLKLEKPDDLPDISTNATNFKELLGAFIVDLPEIETLFSTYTTTQSSDGLEDDDDSKCIQCGESGTDASGNVVQQCLDTSKVDEFIEKVKGLPKEDLNRIFAFIDSLDETDRSLYVMFKSNELYMKTDQITMRELAIEAGLDDVVSVYKWVIPGFNS